MTRPAAREQAAIDTHSRQAAEFAASYAARSADPYSTCFAYSRHRLDAWLDRLLPPATSLRLLDVGCGTGHHMAWLRRRGYEVAGVDGSPDMLTRARELNPEADLREAHVDQLPFANGTFDVVLSIEVLRYLPDPAAALREMARVLRPGGRVVLTAAPLLNLNLYWAVNRLAVVMPVAGLVRLKQFFTTGGALRRRLRRAGFADIQVRGVYWGPLNWIERLARPALPRLLRRWEAIDRRVADAPLLRECANMFVATGVKA